MVPSLIHQAWHHHMVLARHIEPELGEKQSLSPELSGCIWDPTWAPKGRQRLETTWVPGPFGTNQVVLPVARRIWKRKDPRGFKCTSIRELGPAIASIVWIWGPNSLIVVYMDPLGMSSS